jgi:hypothetical protein
MLLAIKNLKPMFQNIKDKYKICLAHALHRVCESIRQDFCLVNEFVSHFKKILKKSPYQIQKYKKVTQLSLPAEVIVTRWYR